MTNVNEERRHTPNKNNNQKIHSQVTDNILQCSIDYVVSNTFYTDLCGIKYLADIHTKDCDN